MVPKSLVAGVMQSQPFPGILQGFVSQAQAVLPRETINRIWSAVQQIYPYQSLQIDPTGRGAIFIGASGPEDMALIQPPLIQVRSAFDDTNMDCTQQAEKASEILRAILYQLSNNASINFGAKFTYWAPSPGGNAINFLRTELVKGEEDLRELAGGNADFQASVKYIIPAGAFFRTMVIEPLQTDHSQLFIEVDTQYPGLVDVNRLKDQILEANGFITGQLDRFLESRAKEWGQ